MALGQRQPIGGPFDLSPDDVQRPLEPQVIPAFVAGTRRAVRPVRDKELLDDRLARASRRAEARVVAGHDAPAEDVVAFAPDGLLDQLAQLLALGPAPRQEDEARAVMPGRRQREPEIGGDLAQEPVGHLDEHARAVAGVGFAAARAPVEQVQQDLQTFGDDVVRPAALDVDDEADAAGVVLVAGVVETDGVRRTGDHGPPVMTRREPEVKYNVPIESMRYTDGFRPRPTPGPSSDVGLAGAVLDPPDNLFEPVPV